MNPLNSRPSLSSSQKASFIISAHMSRSLGVEIPVQSRENCPHTLARYIALIRERKIADRSLCVGSNRATAVIGDPKKESAISQKNSYARSSEQRVSSSSPVRCPIGDRSSYESSEFSIFVLKKITILYRHMPKYT